MKIKQRKYEIVEINENYYDETLYLDIVIEPMYYNPENSQSCKTFEINDKSVRSFKYLDSVSEIEKWLLFEVQKVYNYKQLAREMRAELVRAYREYRKNRNRKK